MDRDPKPDGEGLAYQSTHPRLQWVYIRTKSCLWFGIGEVFTNQTMVQAQDWPFRLYSDLTRLPLARRM